jgi:hypothetical protein
MSMRFMHQDVELVRQHLFLHQRVVNKEVTAAGLSTILQELGRAAPSGH